jgi:hypothetical protein
MASQIASSPDVAMSEDPLPSRQSSSDNLKSKDSKQAYKSLWDYEGDDLKTWIHSIASIFKGASGTCGKTSITVTEVVP